MLHRHELQLQTYLYSVAPRAAEKENGITKQVSMPLQHYLIFAEQGLMNHNSELFRTEVQLRFTCFLADDKERPIFAVLHKTSAAMALCTVTATRNAQDLTWF